MSTAAHTPGPWRANDRIAVVEQADPLGLFVADCRMTDEGRSNARLIAAAPDLLDACRQAKKYLETDLVEPGRTVFWKLVEAIAKADGAEPNKRAGG